MALSIFSSGYLFVDVVKRETFRICFATPCQVLDFFRSRRCFGSIFVENCSLVFSLFHIISVLATAGEETTIIIH